MLVYCLNISYRHSLNIILEFKWFINSDVEIVKIHFIYVGNPWMYFYVCTWLESMGAQMVQRLFFL